uniref:Uncharacterized protein n=1 Tax=Anguilla anguilla TaxID=7936 RepID=A0A0E9UZC3_ANGAN
MGLNTKELVTKVSFLSSLAKKIKIKINNKKYIYFRAILKRY